ncbi:hypothetical protein SAMN02745830_07273, partial [Streptomyces sp. Amel2xC10]
SPPPCAYLMTVVYRDDHDLSAPRDITHYKSVAARVQLKLLVLTQVACIAVLK